VRSSTSEAAWQALFAHSRVQLAHVLTRVGRLELAAYVLDEPVEAVRADVYELAEAGVVADTDPYRLDPGVPALAELLTEIDALRARRWAREIDPEAEVRWHLGPEIVFTAPGPVNHPDVTYGGASLFDDHGIELDVPENVYCRTKRSLDASDAILQSLLLAAGDEDVREACRRLAEREPLGTLAEKALIYGLEDEVAELREAQG
jgi:hypothetical protein